jgi:type I restriction enzyme S subunit
MSRWPTVALGEVCEINPRTNGAELLEPDVEVSFVPMAAVDEVRGRISAPQTRALASVTKGYTRFREDDVLFAKITPCMENGKAAVARELRQGVGFGSTEFHVLRPRPGLLADWLLALVRRPAFRDAAKANFTGSAGQRRVPADFVRQVEIPLPPVSEQLRLLGPIGEAGALRELAAQSDARLQDMYESTYIELFSSGERGADRQTLALEDLLADGPNRIRTGPFGSQLLHSEFTDRGIPVLGIDNVVTNRFRWTAARCISPERFDEFRRFQVFGGDVLITIMGTVGRCCVAPEDLPPCMSTKHLCVLTLNRETADPSFVWGALLFDPEVRRQTSDTGGGAIMRGWNSTIIRRLQLRLPPLSRQRAWAQRVEEVQALEDAHAGRLARLDALYDSVLDNAIGGAL